MRVRIGEDGNDPIIEFPVREFAEFIARDGDLDEREGKAAKTELMLKGAALHRKIQSSMGAGYRSEVPLSLCVPGDGFLLSLQGRADGILENEGSVLIDEIKGTAGDPAALAEPKQVHFAQALCYAFMKFSENAVPECTIQITYVQLETEEIRRIPKTLTAGEVRNAFEAYLTAFQPFGTYLAEAVKARNVSIRALTFPFPYREGQEKLVRSVYRTIEQKKTLFLNASTGIGKTLAVLYPAVHAMGEGMAERIFYLTARTVTGRAAEDALSLLHKGGAAIRAIRLTAKEKLCFLREPSCNPEDCPYAKGYYDRRHAAMLSILRGNAMTGFDRIREAGSAHTVCPYALASDLSGFADVVICDYNYVFDPDARLSRLLDDPASDTVILADEAHNLPNRAREMYSAQLVKEDVLAARRLVKGRGQKLWSALGKLNGALLAWKKEYDKDTVIPMPYSFIDAVRSAMFRFDEYLDREEDAHVRKELLPYYFALRAFLNTAEEADEEHYACYLSEDEEGRFFVKLFCLDPSQRLREMRSSIRSSVFFSATLLPIRYFRRVLGAAEDDYDVYAPSPFAPENRLVVVADDISAKYTERGPALYRTVARVIRDTAAAHTGNYLVFFPSHKMMQDVFAVYRREFDDDRIDWVVQQRMMGEEDREIFLENFGDTQDRSLVGFCVMGGLFSEGIDLTGRKLVGAIVVGTGLPQVSTEGDILREGYGNAGENGFDFAYRFPGMNKVLQAGGRVIRTSSDRGVILLLDSRFLQPSYRSLFPREWSNRIICHASEITEHVKRFFAEEDHSVP